MDNTTKIAIDTCANMLTHTTDFDDSRQAFSLDELNDRLYDHIDAVTDAYIAHKNCLHEARKYTVLMVLAIMTAIIVMAPLTAFIVLACWGEMDTVTAVIVCITLLVVIIFAIIQADIFNDKCKHHKMLADRLSVRITDLYVSVAVSTWPLTHKEDRQ
jgi:hypothetical protein|nr:MAG TPA: SMODS and SLOG-associating 2TM effector domain family 4 [Caudoviricetes sp.]